MMFPAPAIRAYRAAGALAILVAIGYQVSKGLQMRHWSAADYFGYFTILSNLFAAAVLLSGALHGPGPRSMTAQLLRGAAVMYMLTTGLVWAVLLSGKPAPTPWVNAIVHQIMPPVMACDWALDPPSMRLTLRRTLLWLSFPIVYIVYTLTRGAIVNWYPYFFVNPNHSGGYLAVAAGVLVIGAGMIGLIVLITWAGNRRLASHGSTPRGLAAETQA
ncbi:MAG TPA: Pr6Pr family membrane protein [Solirubrobacteraceae bacterium]